MCVHCFRAQKILIDKIGLKDADTYIDPYIDVSVVDAIGRSMGDRQSTPGATQRGIRAHVPGKSKPTTKEKQWGFVKFGHTVHLQTTLEEMGENSAVIFEFIHYKRKEGRNSIRCWCFIDHTDIQTGPQILELYKKPTDPARKKIKLYTEKPLYMHVELTVRS